MYLHQPSHAAKVAVIGSGGKTAFILSAVGKPFATTEPTSHFTFSEVTHNGHKVHYLDVPTTNQSSHIVTLSGWADGFVVLYSIDNKASFDAAVKILQTIHHLKSDHTLSAVLVGTKVDDQAQRQINLDNSQQAAAMFGLNAFEVSAKTGQNVSKVCGTLVNAILASKAARDTEVSQSLKDAAVSLSEFKKVAGFDLISKCRHTVIQQSLVKLNKKSAKQDRHCFLFNDYFVYSKESKPGSYVTKGIVPMTLAVVVESERQPREYAFDLVRLDTNRVYTFFAPSQADKNQWMQKLTEQIRLVSKSSDRQAVLGKAAEYLRLRRSIQEASPRVFGQSLKQLMTHSSHDARNSLGSSLIPQSLAVATTAITKKSLILASPGLFVFPGSTEELEELFSSANTGRSNQIHWTHFSPYTIAEYILSFLAQMPEPVFPPPLIPFLLKALEHTSSSNQMMRETITCLPKVSFWTCQVLFALFNEVCTNTPQSYTLRVAKSIKQALFGPSTTWRPKNHTAAVTPGAGLRPGISAAVPTHPNDKTNELLAFLIKNSNELFKYPPAPEIALVPSLVSDYNNALLEKKFQECRDLLFASITGLKAQKKQELVEFEGSLQSLMITVNRTAKLLIAKACEIIDTEILDAFLYGLTELKQLLTPQKGLFERTLKTTRLRGMLDKKNADLSALSDKFHAYLSKITPAVVVAPRRSSLAPGGSLSPPSTTTNSSTATAEHHARYESNSADAVDPAQASTIKLITGLLLIDPAARDWWQQAFGLQTFMIPSGMFVDKLTRSLNTVLSAAERVTLLAVLDNAASGFVNAYKFTQFLGGFGPFRKSLISLCHLITKKYFHGFLTNYEASRLLELEDEGTYLVRFSTSNPQSLDFVFEYVTKDKDGNRMVGSAKIQNTQKNYQLRLGAATHSFDSIQAVADAYKEVFRAPYDSSLYKQPWFHGDISSEEAEAFLKTEPFGTFLVRFSQMAFTLTVSFVTNGGIQHRRFTRLPRELSKTFTAGDTYGFSEPTGVRGAPIPISLPQQPPNSPAGTPPSPVVPRAGSASSFAIGSPNRPMVVGSPTATGNLMLPRSGTTPLASPRTPVESPRGVEDYTLSPFDDLSQPSRDGGVQVGDEKFGSIEEYVAKNSAIFKLPYTNKHSEVVSNTTTVQDGSIEALIDKLYDGTTDAAFAKTFFQMYRTFTDSPTVLSMLQAKFNKLRFDRAKRTELLRICNCMKLWIVEFSWDFTEDRNFCEDYQTFVTQSIAPELPATSKPLLDGISKLMGLAYLPPDTVQAPPPWALKSAAPEGGIISTASGLRSNLSSSLLVASSATITNSVLNFDVFEVAKQLMWIEWDQFTRINSHELMGQGWLKSDKEKRSPNVLNMIGLANHMSMWVVGEVLSGDTPKKRAAILEYFLTLAKDLWTTWKNFNAVFEILSALDNSSIGRLKQSWALVSKKHALLMEEIRGLMSTDQNWKLYRYSVKNASPPKIPYLGLTLTDLVFMEDANPKFLQNGHVNFTRCELISEVFHQIKICQQEKLNIERRADIVMYFSNYKVPGDKDAYAKSLEIEPRTPAPLTRAPSSGGVK